MRGVGVGSKHGRIGCGLETWGDWVWVGNRRGVGVGLKNERSGCGLETSSFLTILKGDGIRRRGMRSVCLQAKDRKKAVNSATVHKSRFKSTLGSPQ